VYEDLSGFFLHCRHLGHEEYYCTIKKREEQEKKKAAVETTHNNENHTTKKHGITNGTQQEQILLGQHKDQNYNKKVLGQIQSKEQPGRITNKATIKHPTKEQHAKAQWQSQKKKNFKGVNQTSGQEKFKQSHVQELDP